MNSKMDFNSIVLSKLSQEILEHVPGDKQETLLEELRGVDEELSGLRNKLRRCEKNIFMVEILPVIFHKMKNKLTPIMGYAQILQTKISDERQKKRLKKIEKNADILNSQFDLLRDFYAGGESEKETGNLNRILSGLRPYFTGISQKLEVDIALELDPAVPDDRLHPGQIELMATQLVDNAVQAIKEKNSGSGIIEIKTKSGESGYSLSIKDNGMGIEREDIAKIGTPFFSQFGDRAGLGLTLCEKIIGNHDASFVVDSVPGEYSEFTVIFKKGATPAARGG